MKVLVANLGSTSFKYRLFDLPSERQLARGGIDRIGQPQSNCFVEIETATARIGRRRKPAWPTMPRRFASASSQLTNPEWGCMTVSRRSRGDRVQGGFRGKVKRRATRR